MNCDTTAVDLVAEPATEWLKRRCIYRVDTQDKGLFRV